MGGGNLTLALIAVTQLDLMGQCYVILSNQIKRNKRGDIDQTDAFLKLIKDNVNNWGYDQDDIKKFWKRVRHKLVHQSYPKASIQVPKLEDYETSAKLESFAIEHKDKPFLIDNDIVIVIADGLLKSIEDIKAEIVKKLEAGSFTDSHIEDALKFVVG